MHRFFSNQQDAFWRFYADTKLLSTTDVEAGRARLEMMLEWIEITHPLWVSDVGVSETAFFNRLYPQPDHPHLSLLEADCVIAPIESALEKLQSGGHDAVIAVGGGSVLDGAKLLAASAGSGVALRELPSLHELPAPPLPLITIPTTFGTGSEVNIYSHLTTESGKISLRKSWLAPQVALLIGEAGIAMPQRLRYLTGMDAWIHAYEVMTQRYEISPIQIGILREALRMHAHHFSVFVEAPTAENGAGMAAVAAMAGIGLNNGRTGLIHSLAVPLAARFGLSHADSLLPFIIPAIRFNWSAVEPLFPEWDFVEDFLAHLYRSSLHGMDHFDVRTIVPTVSEEDLVEMTEACCADRVLFKENPAPLEEEDIYRLYQHSLA